MNVVEFENVTRAYPKKVMALLAIALLWWGCERKFRYFEPYAAPFGSRVAT